MRLKSYIGDKQFYRTVLVIAIPIMVQNGLTNFVSMLDNIMVGQLGTEAMSGVSIVNQFTFIFNLMVFGAVSAAGIFTAQYHGNGDVAGVRNTFRLKLLICLLAGVLGTVVFALFGTEFISLFLHAGEGEGDLVLTLSQGLSYLTVMLIGLLPYALSQLYASTMRETGDAFIPMVASIFAVLTNFALNLVLIFGHLGFPALGVVGAAIATVISRFVELLFLILWAHTHTKSYRFLVGAYRSLRVPRHLAVSVAAKGLPLMANEVFWSLAVTLRNQCYSVRGLEAVAALNITTTLQNVLSVAYMALGNALAIIVGRALGAGDSERAKDYAKKMIAFIVFAATLTGVLFAGGAFLFPRIYNTTDSVRELATYMMLVCAVTLPFYAYTFGSYYTLRSGGRVMTTVLFDSVYMWSLVVPLCAVLAYFTNLNIYALFAICQCPEVIKSALGWYLLKRGTWVRRLVGDEPKEGTGSA